MTIRMDARGEASRGPSQPGAQVTQNPDGTGRVASASGAASGIEEKPANASGQPVVALDDDLLVYWRLTPGLPGEMGLTTYREAGAAR